jgi:hypothetical protein
MAWRNFRYLLHGRNVRLVPQGDGSAFQWLNCACATAAMHILSECQGEYPGEGSPWPPTGASIRAASGDREGGLLASQIDLTSNRVYGIDPDFQITDSGIVIAKLRAGYGATWLHDYSPINAVKTGSPGFGGNHSAYLADIFGSAGSIRGLDADPLYDARRAGIPLGPQEIPWSTILRASGLLQIGGGTLDERYGRGKMYVGFTRIPYRPAAPVASVRYSAVFGAGGFYIYHVRNGAINAADPRESASFSGPTSAPCTAPRLYAWPSGTARRLVRLTAGALKDEFVAVPQGSVKLRETEVKAA